MKKLAAEFIGTFALVFAGTGAIVVNSVSGGGGHAPWELRSPLGWWCWR